MEKLVSMIAEMGIPSAYDHFAEGESLEPPFLCYLIPGSDNFAADGKVYHRGASVHVEIYTDKKDPALEKKVEDVLDAHEVFYNKSETWIGSEHLYEALYIFGWEA